MKYFSMKYKEEEIKEFIQTIRNRSGFIDIIDAYKLISYYTDIFGVRFIEDISVEDELIMCYDELKSIVMNDTLSKRKCTGCKEIKPVEEFSKRTSSSNGIESKCRDCIKVYRDKRKEYRETRKNKLNK